MTHLNDLEYTQEIERVTNLSRGGTALAVRVKYRRQRPGQRKRWSSFLVLDEEFVQQGIPDDVVRDAIAQHEART